MGKFIDRTGERFITNEGYEIVIIDYKGTTNITIQFQDEHKIILEHKTYQNCKNGNVKNPYHPSVYGVGFIGVGKYSASENGEPTDAYKDWHRIMTSGYRAKEKERYPTYKDVIVNLEIHNFQNFAEWRDNNYYEIEGEQMELDKDILVKGNKEYRFDRMIYVPHRINSLFIKSDAVRGNYPIGVCYDKVSGKYIAQCSITKNNRKRRIYLGYYNTPEEAFLVYKEFKEAYIKEVADEYKERIPDRLYKAMYAWEVEIDD